MTDFLFFLKPTDRFVNYEIPDRRYTTHRVDTLPGVKFRVLLPVFSGGDAISRGPFRSLPILVRLASSSLSRFALGWSSFFPYY
jgi:hypothetical protein